MLQTQIIPSNPEEEEDFLCYLKQKDGSMIDALVHKLNDEISELVDCTACGNCCRSLMINVAPGEPEILSQHLNIPEALLKKRYIEESEQGKMIINTIPCHFLQDNKCSIYEHRFKDCRDFPHLHKPGFVQRLPGTMLHYERCPIIFKVIEQLKNELDYAYVAD